MTPEQMERIAEMKAYTMTLDPESYLYKVLVELLAALEESQQEYELMKFDRDALVKLVCNHQSAVDDACRELVEAQQTIARARHIVEVPPAVFGEGFDWEFHYKTRRKELLTVLKIPGE